MWILHNMGAQCGWYNHRQRDHVAMTEHLAGSSARSGVCWLRLSLLLLLHRASSALVILSFSASECLAESSAIIFPTEGPHCCSQSVSCLSVSEVPRSFISWGKKASLLQPDNPKWVLTIAPSLFVKHFDTLRAFSSDVCPRYLQDRQLWRSGDCTGTLSNPLWLHSNAALARH